MKKILTVFLTMILTFSLTACGTKNNETENPSGNENNNVENNNGGGENKIDYKTWGFTDHFAAENDGPSESYYINFPRHTGVSRGYGLGGNQGDGTAVYLFGQNDYAPKINKLSELFPAYFEQLEYTLGKVYGLRASNFKLSLTDNAPVVIGNYDMHKFTGNIAFDYEGNPQNYNFVAYATTLKSNGAYAYWVVYDTSDNQSNGKLIEEHAYNMAQTFREQA